MDEVRLMVKPFLLNSPALCGPLCKRSIGSSHSRRHHGSGKRKIGTTLSDPLILLKRHIPAIYFMAITDE
jgi:hypothetical protein